MSFLFVLALIANGFLSLFFGVFIETFLTPRKKHIALVAFFFIPVLFMCLALIPGLDKLDDPGVLKSCISYVCALIVVFVFYKDSVPRKLFFTFLSFLVAVPVEMTLTIPLAKYRPDIYNLAASGTYNTPQGVSYMYLLLFAYILVVFIIVAIAKRRQRYLSNEALLYFCLIPLTQSFSMIFSLSKAAVFDNIGSLVTWALLGFSYLVTDIAAYKAIVLISNRKRIEQQNEFYSRQLEMQLEHYDSFSKYSEDLRHLRHDFANQMTVIKHLMETGQNEEASQLLDESYDKMKHLKTITFCENKIANALLFNKYQIMQKKNINFDTNISIPENLPTNIEISDLCRILYNVLDNAIEACADSIDSASDTPPTIELNAPILGGYLIIHCKNPIFKPIKTNKCNNLLSTKQGENHGNGLNILNELSSKYNGNVSINTNDNIFDIKVSISMVEDHSYISQKRNTL